MDAFGLGIDDEGFDSSVWRRGARGCDASERPECWTILHVALWFTQGHLRASGIWFGGSVADPQEVPAGGR